MMKNRVGITLSFGTYGSKNSTAVVAERGKKHLRTGVKRKKKILLRIGVGCVGILGLSKDLFYPNNAPK